MFKHILLPTCRSPLSARAAKAAIRFAGANRARIAGPPIGSETNKVLTHCKLPLLVYR